MITAGELFAYSLGSGIVLAALYLVYKWMMANENQHAYNRFILFAIYAISFAALPVMALIGRMSTHASESASVIDTTIQDFTFAAIPIANETSTDIVLRTVVWIYMIGFTAVAAHTLIIIARLITIIRSGEKQRRGRFTLVIIERPTRLAPFSWGRHMVMNRADYESAGDIIATHEMQHLKSRHWVDLLFAQIAAMVCWYNPAAWLMREELKAVHEYEADNRVLNTGIDARQYQLLLVKKAVGARFPSLANSLNHSKLKKRITMMNSRKAGPARRLRSLALVPALAAAMCVTQLPAVAGVLEDGRAMRLTTDDKVSEIPADVQVHDLTLLINRDSESSYDNVVMQSTEIPVETAEGNDVQKDEPLSPPLNHKSDTIRIIKFADKEDKSAENVEYYIDGVKATIKQISALQPGSIQSISVLKDKEPARIEVTLKHEGTSQITLRMTRLDNIGSTNVEIVGENIDNLSITKAELVNGEDVYPAKSISTSLSDGNATIKIKFKELHTFHDNTAVVLTTNLGIITVLTPHSLQ